MTDLFGPVCPCCGQPVPEQAATSFDQFWRIWPDKRSKEPARKAWGKLTPAERKVALDRCAAWCRKWRKAYPNASHILAGTYLNQRLFLDDVEPAPATQGDKDSLFVKAIKERKHFLLSSLTATRARELIAAGKVTHEECKAAGVQL